MSFLKRLDKRLVSVGVLAAALAATAAFVPMGANASPSSNAAPAQSNPGWVASWAASPVSGDQTSFNNQTVRNIIYTSVSGGEARISLSNQYGTQAVTIGAVDVSQVLDGAQLLPGSTHAVTFNGGQASVSIPAGQAVLSDPVHMQVSGLTELAVDLYLPDPTGPANYHALAWQTNYVASGNQAGDADSTPFTTKVGSWYYVDGVDVLNRSTPGTIVAFGDSITDVGHTEVDSEARWPNYLARRLDAAAGNNAPAVVDEGISANRVLNDTAGGGQAALTRFERDALSQPGVKDVILLEGINDIGMTDPSVTAAQIEAGYLQLIKMAHAAGIKIFAGTLTPFLGSNCIYRGNYGSAAGEAERQSVNHWIRTSHAFDGVVDFDKVTADPGDPQYFNPAYNATGGASCTVADSLHPNDLGSESMADAIPLSWFGY